MTTREDFKNARVCNDEELLQIASDSWDSILKSTLQPAKETTTSKIELNEIIVIKNKAISKKTEIFVPMSCEEDECIEQDDEKHEKLLPGTFYEKFVSRTLQECKEESLAPQKSKLWLQSRKYCITASQFGAAIGHSPYQTPESLVQEKIWSTFKGNAATEWGNKHEDDARQSFIEWFTFSYAPNNNITEIEFSELNLIKFSEQPWMAVSPDGIVRYKKDNIACTDLIEYKCPAYARNTVNHPYSKYNKNSIPIYYYDQIQGIMGYLNSSDYTILKCWFIVWQPHQTWISLLAFSNDYYKIIHEMLKTFYFEKYLPALCHKHNGVLTPGEIKPSVSINL